MRPIPPELTIAVTTLLAYFIGGLPFGYWCVRLFTGRDIRTMGSGNIGATNVHRSAGFKSGIAVLLLDTCKGFLAVWIAAALTHSNDQAVAFAAIAVMVGHCYPIFLRFKGGKAVACFLGAFLFIAPLAIAIIAPIFVATVMLSKHISLGSILGIAMFPVVLWLIEPVSLYILTAAIFAAVLIIYRHRTNISRLIEGKENVFSLKGGSAR